MPETKKITVYVRAPDEDTRRLSFSRIPEISDDDALDKGLSLDGNSLMSDVVAYVDEDTGQSVPLGTALLHEERHIQKLLVSHGYEVEFK